jgi:hypothetical protein
MDYERAQSIKRKIMAGRVAAAQPFPIIYNPVIATKRYVAHKVGRLDEDWYEEGYVDDFYAGEDDDGENDVAPDYFHTCEQVCVNLS